MVDRGGSSLRALGLVFLIATTLSAPATAQGPPVEADTPILLGLQGRGIRSRLLIVRRDGLLVDGKEIDDPMDRSVTAYVSVTALPYDLRATTQIGVALPWVTKHVSSAEMEQTESGLGDITLFVKQLLVQVDRRAETFRVVVKGKAKFPTGDRSTPISLGTGSMDVGGGVVAGWLKGRWGLYADLVYTHNSSDGEVDYADRKELHLSTGYRLSPGVYDRYPSPQLNLFFELTVNDTGKTKIAGREDPDSGAVAVFLGPSLQYIGGRRWLVEASLQLPVVDEPNGTQLGTSWSSSVGMRVLLF